MLQARPSLAGGIPLLIKRNTALLAASQAFVGTSTSLAYGVGPLMVVALTGSASFAGLTVVLFGLSRFLVAYPIGKITDTHGRKVGIQMGLGLALVGTVTVGLSMMLHALGGFVLGMLIFGMGFNAAQQMRVAAADMFPPRLRALAIGIVVTGASLGLLITPSLMWISEPFAQSAHLEPLALPWLMVPALILAGALSVTFVHPDPKEIGRNLTHYYPDYTPPQIPAQEQSAFSARALLQNPRSRHALISNCAGYGNMSIVMVLTSLVLAHHGHSLTAITFSHMFHSAGMFAFSIPLGWLADRYGRERVMNSGVATTLVGAVFVTFGAEYFSVTLGTFLVGIGWAGANVASTALIADLSMPEHRGRAIGLLDSGAAVATVLAAAVTGPLVQYTSLPAAGVAAALVAAVPLGLLILPRVRYVEPLTFTSWHRRGYVARVIRLTLLAPDIVEASLNGAARELTLNTLCMPLPCEWNAQRIYLFSTE